MIDALSNSVGCPLPADLAARLHRRTDAWAAIPGPGMRVGAHSTGPPRLPQINDDALQAEVQRSVEAVGRPVDPVDFADLDGAFDERVVCEVRRVGLSSSVTSAPGPPSRQSGHNPSGPATVRSDRPRTAMQRLHLQPSLSPQGLLRLLDDPEGPALGVEVATRLEAAFAQGAAEGLLQLGAGELRTALPPAWRWWRDFARHYVTALRMRGEATDATQAHVPVDAPDAADLNARLRNLPPMAGAEYATSDVLTGLWGVLDGAVGRRKALGLSVQTLLQHFDPTWTVVGRVHFNLAENRRDADAPFAFLATWTHGLSAQGHARHLPLAQALQAYAGAQRKDELLALLQPVQRASAGLPWLRELVDRGEIFHPLRWSAQEAAQLLADAPALEDAGVLLRLPAA